MIPAIKKLFQREKSPKLYIIINSKSEGRCGKATIKTPAIIMSEVLANPSHDILAGLGGQNCINSSPGTMACFTKIEHIYLRQESILHASSAAISTRLFLNKEIIIAIIFPADKNLNEKRGQDTE